MPEGDTVWRTARELHQALSGDRLTAAELRVPRFATADLVGLGVLETVPRGKHLLTRLTEGLTLHSHLGMEGAWRVHRRGQRWSGGPAHQVRAVLCGAQRQVVGYRLPLLELVRTRDEHITLGHLGPDLLGPDWDEEEAERRLLSDPARPVAEALLDQRNLAGIGNVYRSELCFLARVAPWTPVGQLPDLPRILLLARRLLWVNRDRPRRSTTAETRGERLLWVYGRTGRPCMRCGAGVASTESGPPKRRRLVYWCPRCQRLPERSIR